MTPAPSSVDEVLGEHPPRRLRSRHPDDAFTAFVRADYPRLLRIAVLLTGDHGRGEDILQTVLVRAYQRWSRIARDNAFAYVRAGLVNAHADLWRRRSAT